MATEDPDFRLVPQRYEEAVPVDALTPHPMNVNEGDVGAITESIDALGFYGAVVAQEATGLIIAGEHRWRSAQGRGAETLPVLWLDVDDDTVLRILVGDNRLARKGRDDPTGLFQLLGVLEAQPLGLTGTGYDLDDLSQMARDLDVPAPREVAFRAHEHEEPEPDVAVALIVFCADGTARSRLARRLRAEGFTCQPVKP